MDRRMEVVEALMDLSRASQRVASLISQGVIGEFKDETVLSALGDSKEVIDVARFTDWPAAVNSVRIDTLDFADLRVLEWNIGPVPPKCLNLQTARSVDLVTDDWKFSTQPSNVKIIKPQDHRSDYDVGVIWESAEFAKDPAMVLELMKKCCHKVYIRFRPWTSRDGAFMSGTVNKAFLHLATDMDHQVLFKVVRPLATYEALVKSAGMPVHERRVNTTQPETFFTTNEEVMRVIRERTWGKISFDQAVKIMATDSVDYVLGHSIEEKLR
jgi:hypothetical protein